MNERKFLKKTDELLQNRELETQLLEYHFYPRSFGNEIIMYGLGSLLLQFVWDRHHESCTISSYFLERNSLLSFKDVRFYEIDIVGVVLNWNSKDELFLDRAQALDLAQFNPQRVAPTDPVATVDTIKAKLPELQSAFSEENVRMTFGKIKVLVEELNHTLVRKSQELESHRH